jgi:hypothetical protein
MGTWWSDSILRGISEVDAQVLITWDDDITTSGGPTKAMASDAVRLPLLVGLGRSGITVAAEAPNYLTCELTLLYDDGRVVYSRRVSFDERVYTPRVEGMSWATVWTSAAVGVVGRNNLVDALKDAGEECANLFLVQWYKSRSSP